MEVNDLAIVTLAGLDLNENGKIELTVEIIVPKQGGQETNQRGSGVKGSNPTLISSATGETAADAVYMLQRKLPRAVYWGQLELLVVGEALSRGQFREQVDYLMRDNNIRLRVQPFVCKGTVREFMAFTSPLEQTKADFLEGEAERLFRRPITLIRLVQNLGEKSESAILPYVELTQEGTHSVPYVKGYAVFAQDRLSGVIQGEAFAGMKWMFKQTDGVIETVKLEEASASLISLGVLSVHTRFIPRMVGGEPRMKIEIDTEMSVVQNTTYTAATDPKFIRQAEKTAADDIRHKVETVIKQAQALNADIFGFGEAINIRQPRTWHRLHPRWELIFPSIQVQVHVKVRIRNTGMNNTPVGEPENGGEKM